jgi:uncharacterized membrane protein
MRFIPWFSNRGNCLQIVAVLGMYCFFCPHALSQVSPLDRNSIRSNSISDTHAFTEPVKSAALRFETIDYPGAVATRALGISSKGVVVGSFDDTHNTHGFVLDDGKFKVIDVPGGSSTQVKCMNARGEAVGYYFDSDFNLHGFFWFRGRFRTIDVPFSLETRAEGINDAGVISGEYVDQQGNEHGYLLRDTEFETIDVPSSFTTDVWMVSNDGWLTGDYSSATTVLAYVRTGRGTFITLDIPGSIAASARAINDRHEIVGRWDDDSVPDDPLACSTQCHGFYWRNGRSAEIRFPGALYTLALGINNTSVIVGRYVDAANSEHGFIVRPKDDFE